MAKFKKDSTLLSAVVSVGSASAFCAFNPQIPQGSLDQMRAGYKPSAIASLVIGGIASLAHGSEYPVLASLGTTALMIFLYEMRIRETSPAMAVPTGGVAPAGTTPVCTTEGDC